MNVCEGTRDFNLQDVTLWVNWIMSAPCLQAVCVDFSECLLSTSFKVKNSEGGWLMFFFFVVFLYVSFTSWDPPILSLGISDIFGFSKTHLYIFIEIKIPVSVYILLTLAQESAILSRPFRRTPVMATAQRRSAALMRCLLLWVSLAPVAYVVPGWWRKGRHWAKWGRQPMSLFRFKYSPPSNTKHHQETKV